MKSKTQMLSYVMLVIGVALLAVVAVYALDIIPIIFQVEKDIVPRTISALPRIRKISGQKAIENIQQLHGKDFYLEDGALAEYGSQNVIIWVADAGSERAAVNLMKLMKGRISEGNSPFKEIENFELLDFTIHELEGLGQLHYYWQADNLVIWLAADEAFAEGALGETVLYYQ